MNRRFRHCVRATILVASAALAQGACAELARIDVNSRAGTIVAYAGEPGGFVADELEGARNSPYVDAILRYIEAPLDVGSMFRWVRDAVLESTSGRQNPVTHLSLSGRSVYLAADPASHPPTHEPEQGAEQEAKPSRVALTIGNSAYDHIYALKTPVNDAAEIAAALERLGFAVVRLEDADAGALKNGLREFGEMAADAEIAAIFYAGHGIDVGGRHLLVPVDAKLVSTEDVAYETVPLDLAMQAVKPASILRLIIVDAMFEASRASGIR